MPDFRSRTGLEVRSETIVSAREDSLFHMMDNECFYKPDIHFTAAVSLAYRISRPSYSLAAVLFVKFLRYMPGLVC